MIEFSGISFANLLCNFVWSKIDFVGTKVRLTSAILDGFSWFKRHMTPNFGHNILGYWIFFWDCQLGRSMLVGHDLWQPPEMLVGQKKSLRDHFLRYIKFENVIGLEISSGILSLHMTYSLTWLKSAKLYGKRKNVVYFR